MPSRKKKEIGNFEASSSCVYMTSGNIKLISDVTILLVCSFVFIVQPAGCNAYFLGVPKPICISELRD